jgi:hypothetical protein
VEELEPRTVPAAFAPGQIRHAYAFDQITAADGSALGTGQTIAIVNAYDNPTIASDLSTFNGLYGLPDAPSFRKVSQTGSATDLPAADVGWSAETALDVQWAHAIAPGAGILLVEANSSSLSDLLAAVDYARSQPGVSAVSMSWGGSEFSSERLYDSHFTTPAGHTGVTFVAASGDSGAAPSWPAVSPNVLGVGGTSLNLTRNSDWGKETGWGGSGGGVSRYEPKPAYQTSVATPSATSRTSPDVAYDANPSTGFRVYDSQNGGSYAVGGTSAGAPQWAALVAIANQGRALAGKAPLDGPSQTLYAVYQAAQASYSTDYHDVTSGNNGYRAGRGYDMVTGLGTPVADKVVSALVAWTGSGSKGQISPAAIKPAAAQPAATQPVSGGTPTKATRAVTVATPVPVAPPELAAQAPVAPAAPAVNVSFPPTLSAPGPAVAPTLSPGFPTSLPQVAGDAPAAPPAGRLGGPAPVPMNAPDAATDGPGFWDWLYNFPGPDRKTDEPDGGDGDGAEADVAVSGVAVGD